MSNLNEKKEITQELIKETAKNLFFVEGKFNATTQEIADAAGVNRTLINYYFRSRDNLMKIVLDEAKNLEGKKSFINSKSHLKMNKDNSEHDDLVNNGMLDLFYKNLKKEMREGHVENMEPVQFLLNLASLLMFPITMRPLLMEKLKISKESFDELLNERKDIIMNLLFK